MKRLKKAVILCLSVMMIGGSTVGVASASGYRYDKKTSFTYWTETANYTFDNYANGQVSGKVRFITTPTCSVSGAKVTYNLHVAYTNKVINDTQTHGMGAQVKPWWFTKKERYHVDMIAFNNKSNAQVPQAVNLTPFWLENFTGNP